MAGAKPGTASAAAATGPFESLFAEGHMYRQAVERPRNLIVLLGIWVIFGMTALGGAVMLLFSSPVSVDAAIAVVMVITSAVILWKTTRNHLRKGQESPSSRG